KFCSSLKWARTQVGVGKVRTRKPTAWNAYVRERMQEVNKDLRPGETYTLINFMRAYKSNLREGFQKLTPERREELRNSLVQVQAARVRTIRANPRAVAKNVDSTFKEMTKHWLALCNNFGVEGMFIATRSSVEDTWNPHAFCTPKAASFCKRVLQREPETLALQVESWSVNAASKLNRSMIYNRSRTMILDGLNAILAEINPTRRKIGRMNYTNYEKKIVEAFGVELVG
ncbi:hypothetical protein BDN72DRAFT_744131, partial [Pluteus cervinus]